MRIYFDNCCLNRPYDDLTNNAVRMECEAILSIIDNCGTSNWSYFSSDVLLDEILEISDNDRREKVMLLYPASGFGNFRLYFFGFLPRNAGHVRPRSIRYAV